MTETLGGYIRMRLDHLGMNQTTLAVEADIHPSVMSLIVRDKRATLPEPVALRRIADVLQVRPADLLIAAGYLDADDDERAGSLHETAVVYDVERRLAAAERDIQAARKRLRDLRDERGVVVTDGSDRAAR